MSSINGQLISEQLKEVFPATMELCILAFGFCTNGRDPPSACWRA
uniref:Peptide transport system permease protein SapB n=1 Tax=Klebsiella pneumoniae TaxID=573 RepID=A0A8B0SW46_KLEPN|nr:Peptide transport system permease protein SapB [Klebsiella pneumoniae]